MDKSRQQFEKEFKKRVELPTSDIFKINDDTCEYYYMTPRQAWYWWQASRESLEIELPENKNYGKSRQFDDGYERAIDDCENTLISYGVRIKND